MTVRTVTDLRFLGDWGVWLAVVVALLIAGVVWWWYRRETEGQTGNARWLLPMLRAEAVFFIVLMLAGPVLHHRKTIGELARVIVFVDASKSMGVTDDFMDVSRKLLIARSYSWLNKDVLPADKLGTTVSTAMLSNPAVVSALERVNGASRWARVEQLLLDERDGVLPKLANKHNVELWALVGTEPQRLWSGEQGLNVPKSLTAKPESDDTDLSDPISARIGQRRDERCAVVLLSDGQHNFGGSPLEMAKIAGGRNVPVFTVGIGAFERPADLAVMDVSAPQTVFFEDRVRGEITLKDDMAPGQAFLLKIEEGGQTVWEKPLITERTHRRKIEFDFPIKEMVEAKKNKAAGADYSSFPLTLKVSITPLIGEKDATNNETVFRFRALTQRRKLLVLDGRPRWEFRYIRNMFERDPQWEVNSLVAGTELNDEWLHGDQPGQLPSTREALFAYDLIAFGEVPQKLLRGEELEWIKEFVGTRGGGVIFVDGQRDVLRSYDKTPLGPLFPVEWLGKGLRELPVALQLTDRGQAFGPMRLVADANENAAIWKQLRPPHWVANTKALPGTETLVEAVLGSQALPAIVLRQFGAGKVMFLGTDETWRWRYDVADKYQDPFWHQIANAVMEPPYSARDKYVAVDAGNVNYQAGDSAEIRVRLRDEQGRIVTKGHPTVNLFRDGQKIASLMLSADENSGGVFRGKTAALLPGRYEVRVDAGRLVPETTEMPVEFYVQRRGGDASRELSELTCNEELLQQLSRASAGEYYREEDAAQVVKKLDPMSKGRIEESETVLWQSWYWFIPVIGLLTVEWVLRKRTGLI